MKMDKIALAGLATAALVFAPSAGADVPGMAPFVGCWHAHEEGLELGSGDPICCGPAAAREGYRQLTKE